MFYNIIDKQIFRDFDLMDRWMEEIFQPGVIRSKAFVPQINVFRKDDQILVEASVPGLDSEDLEIYLKEGYLMISGERKGREGSDPTQGCLGTGRFQRSLKLPFRIDENSLDATLKNGILQIVLKQVDEDKPRKLEIKIEEK